ncbi:hypothetical protein HG530_005964 [Fusarium avenaceum]|nr:hypothetical protein HG530_005964 [Fusarium avenaceum]
MQGGPVHVRPGELLRRESCEPRALSGFGRQSISTRTYQYLEGRVQLANGVFKNDIDGPVIAISVEYTPHNRLRIISILLIRIAQFLLDHTHTHNFVSVIDKLLKQPLQRIIGVSMLVDSDHKASRPAPSLVSLMSNIERERDCVVLGRFAGWNIVKRDMFLEPIR